MVWAHGKKERDYKINSEWLDGWYDGDHGQQSNDGERCAIV